MKKTLLSLGTIVSAVAPIASVIACGDGDVPGHETPYSISIQADEVTPTQANFDIKLKGYVSESYIKEIKSKIAESIAKFNKDLLKYSTIRIRVGNTAVPINVSNLEKWIHTSPLTDANKNDLDAIHNFIDSAFDDLISSLKSNQEFSVYFKKENWENIHHQIDKLDQDEVKLRILKLLGFENVTNPDVIDFEYEVISNKYINFTVTRTNVVSSPELIQYVFSSKDTSYYPFLEGEKINLSFVLNFANEYPDNSFDPKNDSTGYWYKPGISNSKYGIMSLNGATGNRHSHTQLFKIAQYLLKANGYSDDIIFASIPESTHSTIDDHVKVLGDSASKVFAYGDNGQTAGINFDSHGFPKHRQLQVNFEKKTFKIKYTPKAFDEKQWIFGTDGHIVVEPSHEWTLEFEGTYDLNSTNDAIETITSLTKAIASDGTHTIHLLESSAKLIAKSLMNDADNINLFFNGW